MRTPSADDFIFLNALLANSYLDKPIETMGEVDRALNELAEEIDAHNEIVLNLAQNASTMTQFLSDKAGLMSEGLVWWKQHLAIHTEALNYIANKMAEDVTALESFKAAFGQGPRGS